MVFPSEYSDENMYPQATSCLEWESSLNPVCPCCRYSLPLSHLVATLVISSVTESTFTELLLHCITIIVVFYD